MFDVALVQYGAAGPDSGRILHSWRRKLTEVAVYRHDDNVQPRVVTPKQTGDRHRTVYMTGFITRAVGSSERTDTPLPHSGAGRRRSLADEVAIQAVRLSPWF